MHRSALDSYLPASSIAAVVVMLFLIAAGIVFGASAQTLPLVGIVAAAALVLFAAVYARRGFPRASAFAVYFLPLIAYPILYEPVHALMATLNPGIIDARLLAADEALFGANPITALHSISFPALTDFAYLAYFSYYFGMPVLLILMFIKSPRCDFEKVLLVMTLGWYVALVSYLLFPALGPQRYLADSLPALRGSLPTSDWIQGFLTANLTPVVRDCVPSMHTGITALTLAYAFRYKRGFFFVYLIPGLGLIFATMYLQQHYVIDVLLGLATAGVLYYSVEALYQRRTRPHHYPVAVND